MASDLKSGLVMTAFQRCPNLYLMGNPAVGKNDMFAIVLRLFQIYVRNKMYERNCRVVVTRVLVEGERKNTILVFTNFGLGRILLALESVTAITTLLI